MLGWLTNRSFRFKLSAATLISLLAMLGLLVWQTWIVIEADLRSQLRADVGKTNMLLASALALPLAQRDYATLADIASGVVVQRNSIDYVVVEDHRERRVAIAGWDAGRPLPTVSQGIDDVHGDHLHVRQPIMLSGQKLGEFQYSVSLAAADRTRLALSGKLLRVGAVGVLFGLLLLVPLGFWVTRRLGLLETAALRLASGKLDERIDLPGKDELSRLAGAFNHMADSLAETIADLRTNEARFHHAVRGSNDGIWDWDLIRGTYYFSPRHKIMLGYRDDELANDRSLMESLVTAEDQALLADAIQRHFEKREPFDCEFRMRHKDGHLVWCRSRGQAIWNALGEVVRFSGATSDITEHKNAAVALEQLAHYDALTQLPNRTLLADRLAMALAQARRSGDRVAVALLDLDGFKPINDNHGHDAGDLILIEVANRLRASLREVDTVARLGGDEFVLVLSGFREEAEYQHSLRRVLVALAQPYQLADATVSLSGSIGVTFFPADDADADTLMRHADQAMYLAKQAGRNRYHIFDAAMDRTMQLQLGMRQRIIAALEAGEFRLHYQPKVNLREGRVIGAEALIRWQHPERGVIAPGEFLPQVDDNDSTVQLSEWVINTALTQMEQWRAQGLELGVSVNLPAGHLQDAGFADFLEGALGRHPAARPQLFELEVLESAALEDVVGVSARMQRCRELGVRFALDDFGTGYASLAYLRRLPIELLKIDQSFVRDMLQDPDDLAIVEGVIGLATAFTKTAIAEGVETIDHAVMLLHLGCDLAQGYGIARPMPAAALPGWIAGWKPDPALAVAARHTLERQDLPLASVEVEHRRWVDLLMHHASDAAAYQSEEAPLATTACRFGQWLHGDGSRRYGDLAEFRAIDGLHEQVHVIGRRIVELCGMGRHDRAREELPQLLAGRDELVTQLHALIAVLAGGAHHNRQTHSPR
ncbi:MAG: EAL domain-containing protein [Gammaproteobacteria bacterium]|nr:EAL domain-containing protein [Gammaproteobacteria bacterium]MBU1645205.1 EAL domain-containing protein [Gammaproteobacteria bacterium]MBU1973442.1 EAL domain-containing protein [Gammaproteobacteria bacterium]